MLRILALCLTAALICSMLRSAHPQLAAAVALGCGVAAMMLSLEDLGSLAQALRRLEDALHTGGGNGMAMVKLCGVALVAEFASDICRDAGETALARRIDTGVKLGVVAAALPAAGRIMESIAELIA